jgi:2-hydroxychromene-2-carboxylate isomerase
LEIMTDRGTGRGPGRVVAEMFFGKERLDQLEALLSAQ